MADAVASKATEGNLMGVQVPSPAFNLSKGSPAQLCQSGRDPASDLNSRAGTPSLGTITLLVGTYSERKRNNDKDCMIRRQYGQARK